MGAVRLALSHVLFGGESYYLFLMNSLKSEQSHCGSQDMGAPSSGVPPGRVPRAVNVSPCLNLLHLGDLSCLAVLPRGFASLTPPACLGRQPSLPMDGLECPLKAFRLEPVGTSDRHTSWTRDSHSPMSADSPSETRTLHLPPCQLLEAEAC